MSRAAEQIDAALRRVRRATTDVEWQAALAELARVVAAVKAGKS